MFGSMRHSETVFVETKLPYVTAWPDSSHRQAPQKEALPHHLSARWDFALPKEAYKAISLWPGHGFPLEKPF